MKATATITLIDGTWQTFEVEEFDYRRLKEADEALRVKVVEFCLENCYHAADLQAVSGNAADGSVLPYGKVLDEFRERVRLAEKAERERVLEAVHKMEAFS